ncbi:MAG: Phage integrase family, partial [Brevundimonas sp.]|nr:Phage integrase family [Brevundimonas sp.]
MTGGKRVAALSVITLGAAYEFAISLDRLSNNPTKGVERFQTVRRERYLSEREFAALAEALTEFEREEDPLADDAIAILRRRWDEARPADASRGHNSGDVPSAIQPCLWVLPAMKGEGHFVGLPHLWTKVKARADAIM